MNDIFLSRISIQDFRTFGDFEIDIPPAPGLLLLTGTNGLGKSSFFDAIEWCLTSKIRRFDPYLRAGGKKKLEESDYLTRRGAEPGVHRVSLTFSGNDPIERGAGKTTPIADIIAQLARPDRRTINDLGTYLALTHFLGQAAQQRFTSRDPHDQWQALKGPSGIDRLERIRSGLRGRPTVMAFNRRIENERASIAAIERNIADWQGWMTRLARLRAAARASGVLTAAEVSERIKRLEDNLMQLTSGQPLPITGENVAQRLAAMGDRIAEAVRATVERKTALETLAPIAAQFAISQAESQLDAPALVRLRRAVSDAQAHVDRVSLLVAPANDAVAEQQAAIATIDQNIAILEAGRTDLSRSMQLADMIAADQTDRAQLVGAIDAHKALISEADQAIKAHAEAVADLARLRSVAASAKAQDESMRDYLDLISDAGITADALAKGREAAERAAADVAPAEMQLADLDSRIADAELERTEADRHATAISSALSQLASHLHEDDTDCPVCRTHFEPGALKALADAAAAGSDSRLAQADDILEGLRTSRAELAARIAALRTPIEAVEKLQRDADAAERAFIDARGAIAQALGVPEGSNYVAIAASRRSDAEAAVAAAETSLDALAASAAVATEQRVAAASDLDGLTNRVSQLGTRLSQLQAENVACADRLAARNLSDVTISEIEARLTTERGQGEAARAQLVRLTDAAAAAVAAARREQAVLDAAQRDLAAAELTRVNAEQSALQLQRRWSDAGLSDSPSQDSYERGRAVIDAALGELHSLAERQLVLARENEDTLLQGEIDEIMASMRAAGGDQGARDPAAYLATLESALATARVTLKVTTTALDAVKLYSEDLQSQADDFSSRVLDPLNTVIDDFNEAMLSTPGESIQFKADTRVDATSFGMALRYRERVENAIETRKDLPPQVVLSEGQLAANGFSILCAASTAYPWSRWRALLLDDPLQHNDIIHTAAFVDVMRNMVELNGYQLVMSSHDRGESDFIARKFDAAGLPCSTVLLTAPSAKGVAWEKPEHNQAAARILRLDREASANIA
ncbi:AAA family ATPase [Rhizobium sp. FKL33]|uniref:AAA family ATPase n=1 Tax=Rhizobium sp. FKL33 TaxID=2562307 RepID=UPI0010C00120|nr:AAA family ATPase [Rhizobium sp. FKL33]